MPLPNTRHVVTILVLLYQCECLLHAQPLGLPDRSQPGDRLIQAYLARHAERVHAKFADDVTSLEVWQEKRLGYRQ